MAYGGNEWSHLTSLPGKNTLVEINKHIKRTLRRSTLGIDGYVRARTNGLGIRNM